MPKRISKATKTKKPRGRKDANQTAFAALQRTIERSEDAPEIDKATISAVMSALGKKGGRIGGKRRLETMTPEERSQRALQAARARWTSRKK